MMAEIMVLMLAAIVSVMSVSSEAYKITLNTSFEKFHLTTKKPHYLIWDGDPIGYQLPPVAHQCKLIFHTEKWNITQIKGQYQVCVRAKQYHVTEHTYQLELCKNNSLNELCFKKFDYRSRKEDIRACLVTNDYLIIRMKSDNTQHVDSRVELVIYADVVNNNTARVSRIVIITIVLSICVLLLTCAAVIIRRRIRDTQLATSELGVETSAYYTLYDEQFEETCSNNSTDSLIAGKITGDNPCESSQKSDEEYCVRT